MKYIIEIPEDLYKEKIRGTTSNRQDRKILECVKNGTPLEAELEEIKAEMEVIHDRYKINFQGYSMSVAQDCIDIIDQRIAELKGEQE